MAEMNRGETKPERRLILVGNNGSGKSTTGNALLGRYVFFNGRLKRCKMMTGMNKTRNLSLRIVDTPGLFDIDIPFAERALEIQRSVDICSGPHAFLIVISAEKDMTVRGKFTDTIDMMRLMFGENVFESAIIVFTHGKSFVCDKDFRRFWTEQTELAQLVSQCEHRVVRVENVEECVDQDDEIMKMVNGMSMNGMAVSNFPRIEIHRSVLQDHLENYNGDSSIQAQVIKVKREIDAKIENVNALKRSETKIILIGKSGNGKSSTGNTLLGYEAFYAKRSLNAVTEICDLKTGSFMTHKLNVVDTPGLFDTGKRLAERALEVQRAVKICPGPHAFLLVFSGANRMTEEEKFTIDLMRVMFGERVFNNTIIVCTRGSEFTSDAEFKTYWEEHEEFKNLVVKCNSRILRVENENGRRDEAWWDILNAIQCLPVYTYQYLEIHKNTLEEHLKYYSDDKRDIHKEVADVVGRLGSILCKETWTARLVAGGALLGTVACTGGASVAAGMAGIELGTVGTVASGMVFNTIAQFSWRRIKRWWVLKKPE
ncbi:GTPase IMAP family member 8-like [Mercenaria mercenaria]|uniref:GTPase IMAP family member 8-like n=1 Tax=Mercenaria mercenaria TaxID=6596 RepID=UPI00234E8E38|nr:GTPase IMAP family member 8-like [Mercenaria mercenaria]